MTRRSLTPNQLAECAALKSIYFEKKDALGLTQELAAERLGMTQASFSHYLNGRNGLNLEFAIKAAGLLEVPVSAFSPRLAVKLSQASAPADLDDRILGDVRVRSGEQVKKPAPQESKGSHGYPVISWSSLSTAFLPTGGIPIEIIEGFVSTTENAGSDGVWIRVKGPSMRADVAPSFPEGTLILVALEAAQPEDGRFYLFRNEAGEFVFRRFLTEGSATYLLPLNQAFQPEPYGDSWRVIGRVVDAKMPGL
ncbi:LexA family transcriptional regulator [Pseudomonas sp. zfem003]|uniref:LexA family transcriptional regulator n=1 Tax=Pseudomonas sp. zfem003 TaxID=3078198 RepID=UPI002928B525|nr:LexA family transcriptional regulator [Pseudomonas sp. zfem003]MDU9400861.1 LexA family transcriptional regulator [Pseudomonas sp. zfem003]